jgi:uncharacterized membrane protein
MIVVLIIMGTHIFKRHKTSSIVLLLYCIWWLWIVSYFLFPTQYAGPICDFRPVAMVLGSATGGLGLSVGFTIKSILSKEPERFDYLLFLGFVSFPLVLGGLCLIGNA